MIPVMLFSACAPEPQPPSAEQLEMSVREILELPTYEQVYRDIVYVGEKQKVLFITTIDKEVLFSIDIRVQAGVKNTDLIDVEITGNNENGMKTAVVYIPDTEILLVDADESSIEQYFLKEKGEEISRLEYYDEINRKKDTIIQSAIDSGLLEQANTNARTLISSFLLLAGIEVTGFRRTVNG